MLRGGGGAVKERERNIDWRPWPGLELQTFDAQDDAEPAEPPARLQQLFHTHLGRVAPS